MLQCTHVSALHFTTGDKGGFKTQWSAKNRAFLRNPVALYFTVHAISCMHSVLTKSSTDAATWAHDNSYVFYVKCGSINRTFTYVFTGTKTYNTDVFSASKRTNTYVFSAFKRWKLTYWHLKINPYEYWNRGINFIISCHINYLVFSCLLVYLIWNDNISFCFVWFLPARFQE